MSEASDTIKSYPILGSGVWIGHQDNPTLVKRNQFMLSQTSQTFLIFFLTVRNFC